MGKTLEKILQQCSASEPEKVGKLLDYFLPDTTSADYQALRFSLESKLQEALKLTKDQKIAAAFVLAASTTSAVRAIQAEIVLEAAKLKAKKSAPRQSTLFRVLEVEAEIEALSSLLYRAASQGIESSDSKADVLSALLCSVDLLEQVSALIFALDTQEPQELFPSGSSAYLKTLSLLGRVNRELGDTASLAEYASESRVKALGVLG